MRIPLGVPKGSGYDRLSFRAQKKALMTTVQAHDGRAIRPGRSASNGSASRRRSCGDAAMREPFWKDEMLLSLSRPDGWRDEHGRLRETIPCPRCGRIMPLHDPSAEVMRLHEWTSWMSSSP